MSRVTRINWGYTYNTGNCTSCRMDLEYALDDSDELYETLQEMGSTVNAMMCALLRTQGVKEVYTPWGKVDLLAPNPEDGEGGAGDLPF